VNKKGGTWQSLPYSPAYNTSTGRRRCIVPSKLHCFICFFFNNEWNSVVSFIKKNDAKSLFLNQSLIFYLFNQILNWDFNFKNQFNCILSNSNFSPEVGCIFYFSPWFWICVFWPSIDQQTSYFFNLATGSVNFSPYIYVSFPV